jgi:pyruvate kinase
MDKFTKIVATISDRNCDAELIRSLYKAGMNVVRMNSAHLKEEGIKKIVDNVRSVSTLIGLMLDTKGPEIRTTTNAADTSLHFKPGMKVTITGNRDLETTIEQINLNYADIAKDVNEGNHLLFDDGALDFIVDSVDGETIHATCQNEGKLGSRKSVNIPGVAISLPSVTEADKRNIEIAAKLDIDFIAHSFVRTAHDVLEVKRVIERAGGDMEVIAKIENQQGVDNFDDILDTADGIMIARGDLGVEVAAERIPALQNMMIKRCIARHKPVIVATQMLHSMINSPRPTRAEVTDVAHAVVQRADALMLSGETANGRYPVEAVTTMASIAREIERSGNDDEPRTVPAPADAEVTTFLARQAVLSERLLSTRAILTDTYRGRTARYVASFRGNIPTIALCYSSAMTRRLALSYGVKALYRNDVPQGRTYIVKTLEDLIAEGIFSPEDRVAYLGGHAGNPVGATILEIDRAGRMISES